MKTKTLKNQTLLYDKDCPLCQLYTSGFIKVGMLDSNGRKPYSNITSDESKFIDTNRATNEIALVDNENKTVIYGIDSLLKILGVNFPFIETIGNLKPIKFFLKKLYSFISYNRKVIIPSKRNKEEKTQCIPDFNTKYRITYILFAALVTVLVLFNLSKNLTILPQSSIIREINITVGQILFQTIFLLNLKKKTIINYIGNLMTVSLMGSLILIPLLLLVNVVNISEKIILFWLGITVVVMFKEHYRRIRLLELPHFLSYTWILYRILILLFILILN